MYILRLKLMMLSEHEREFSYNNLVLNYSRHYCNFGEVFRLFNLMKYSTLTGNTP